MLKMNRCRFTEWSKVKGGFTMIAKKILTVFFGVLLAFALSSCNVQQDTDFTEQAVVEEDTDFTESVSDAEPDVAEPVAEQEQSLADYDSWWHLDDNYPDGMHIIEIFYLDGTGGVFTAVDVYGNELHSGGASLDSDGNIVLSVDLLGDFTLSPGDEGLYDEDGVLAFVIGEAPEAPDANIFSGKWYLNGDISADYYELNDDVYNKISADGYDYGESSYTISDVTRHYNAGEPLTVVEIQFGESSFDSGVFSPGYELFVISDFDEADIYIRESAIGTAECDAAIELCSLLYDDWKATDKSFGFRFYQNGAFEYLTRMDFEDGAYTFEAEDSGSWNLDGEVLTLIWTDGTEDLCDLTGNTFYVPSLDATTFNGKADAGVLDKWYGNFTGELGEVFISSSIFDNTVDVSIYLNDEIGSMYGAGLEFNPTGETAADEHFILLLDSDTLTIEPISADYEHYAGVFERQ
jgi:hypothetical protein